MTNMLPEIIGLKHKVKTKFEIEIYVSIKNNTLDKFKRKWAIDCNLLLNIKYSLLVRIISCCSLGSNSRDKQERNVRIGRQGLYAM